MAYLDPPQASDAIIKRWGRTGSYTNAPWTCKFVQNPEERMHMFAMRNKIIKDFTDHKIISPSLRMPIVLLRALVELAIEQTIRVDIHHHIPNSGKACEVTQY